MPTIMFNNSPRQPGPTAGPNQPLQYPTQHFNPHFPQPPSSQASPLLHPGQPFNPQLPPPYFHNMHLLTALPWAVKLIILQ